VGVVTLRESLLIFYFFFFFQAEDGIRDRTVTGVQTCALPISSVLAGAEISSGCGSPSSVSSSGEIARTSWVSGWPARWLARMLRSEERRVGKERRSRWSSCHYKKNAQRQIRCIARG